MKIEDDFSEDQKTTDVEAAKYKDKGPMKASKSIEYEGTFPYEERKYLNLWSQEV